MKVLRIILAFLAFALPSIGADMVTATITITNNPVGNTNTITVNGSTRTWTNDVTASVGTLVMQTNSTAKATTNLLTHLGNYPPVAGQYLSQTTETNVTLRALPGVALTVTIAGGWASVVYTTNTVERTFVVRMPITVEAATNQTNIASLITAALDKSTNSVSTNATALQNFLTKGASPRQTITGPVSFNAIQGTNTGLTNGNIVAANLINVSNVTGRFSAITNGYWTNGVFDSPKATNLTVYGSMSSVGDGAGAEQYGAGAHARGDQDTAVGATALATNAQSTAVGYASVANAGGVAVGNTSTGNTNSVGIGIGARAAGVGNVVAGAGADDDGFSNVVLLCSNCTATEDNSVQIGGIGQNVTVTGNIVGSTSTNSTLRGTNVLNGRLDLKPRSNTGLANGYNSAVVLGTNVYVRFSGPSGAYTNVGFSAEQDGSWHIAQFDNPGLSMTFLHDSGLDATAANRIYTTETGALVNSTNNPVMVEMIYDGAVSRWRLISVR